jgi:hypothetical protein
VVVAWPVTPARHVKLHRQRSKTGAKRVISVRTIGALSLTEYRAYLLDETGRIFRAAILIRVDTDEEAIEAARDIVDAQVEGQGGIELWQEKRLVATLKRERSRSDDDP